MKRILLMTLLMLASYASAQLTLSTNPVSGAPPLTVVFKATCAACTVYTWDFGDKSGPAIPPGPNQTHVYKAAGVYFAIVAATDSKGAAYNGQATIKVAVPVDAENRYCGIGNVVLGPASDGPAKLPEKCLNTSLANTPSPGSVVAVPAGGNLQAVYNALVCGQTLSLAHGATWTGPFKFTPKNCPNTQWITITSDGTLPKAETRISPAALPQMATISMKPNAQANDVSGDHIRFIGIAWMKQPGGPLVDLVTMVGANNIIFDRNYAHGNPGEEVRRFVTLSDSTYAAVVDSWIDEMHCIAVTGTCVDAQAVAAGASSTADGVWKIVNNTLSASAETIIFGGATATTTPCDIEIRNNYMFKPLSWNPSDPSFVPPKYIVKNLFELKNVCRLLLEGNVLKNTWGGFSQNGSAILITPKNQETPKPLPGDEGQCPLCFVSDITMRYNYISTTGVALQVADGPNGHGQYSAGGHNYSIHDMVFDNLQYATCYACGFNLNEVGSGYLTANPPPPAEVLYSVTFNHLTFITASDWPGRSGGSNFQEYGALTLNGPPTANTTNTPQIKDVVFENSLFHGGTVGMYPSSGGGITEDCAVPGPSPRKNLAQMVEACWIGESLFSGNAVIGYTGALPWPAGNMFTASWATAGLVNYNNGNGGNYALKLTSPFKNKALDKKDPGANIALVNQYTKTAVSGVQQ